MGELAMTTAEYIADLERQARNVRYSISLLKDRLATVSLGNHGRELARIE